MLDAFVSFELFTVKPVDLMCLLINDIIVNLLLIELISCSSQSPRFRRYGSLIFKLKTVQCHHVIMMTFTFLKRK